MVNQLYLILLKIFIFLPIITFGQSKKNIYLCLQDTNAVKQSIIGHIQLFSPNNKHSDFIFNSKDSCLQISFSSKGVHHIIIEAETYQTESFTFKSDTLLTNFRFNIFLKRKIINLQEVIIRPEDRISQHGDTLIIKTNGITTKPHASASELLNKIPGVSVGNDGDVTIMGKSVEQVTVNGQSLFGGNSKATLEAIKGDMIQQLELIEPQDGMQGSKRLNLRTKKDKSNGIYSEIGSNGGTSETYLGTVKVNQISPKKFQNFFISTNNINEKLLTAQNESQMLSLIFNSIDGGYSITESTENRTFKVGDNRFDNSSVIQRGKEGINSSLSGGYNYSQSNDKREIFGFVLGDISHQNLFKKATTIQNFDFRKQNQNENTSSFVNNSQLWSSLQAKFKINSKNTLRLVNNFSLNNRQTNEINHRISTLLENSQELSNFQTTRNLDEKINYISTSQQVLLIHRYEKPAKVFSFYGSHFYGNSQTENTYINEILSNNLLVKGNNQQLIRNNQEQYIDFQVVQSLPVSRKLLFDAKLGFTSETYPISQNGYQFNSLDKSYSIKRQDLSLNNFISNEKQGYLFLNFFYKSPKLSFIPGIGIWQGNTSRNLLNSNISFQRNRIYPRLNLSYQISKDSRFSIKYNESQQSPNASQLFPLADSSNLQFIRSGNPSLKSFSKQSLQTNFSTSLKTSHHFSLGVQYQEEKNQFVTNSLITDSGGTLQSVSQLGKAKQVNATLFLMQFSRTKPYNYFFMYFMNWRESNVLLNGQPKLIENFIGNFSANLKWLPNQKQSYQLELKSTKYIQKGQNLANSNLRNEFIVKGENEWGKDFYSDFKINYNFTNSLNGKSIINPIIDASINKYISKNKKIKLFATAKNLLNTQNIFIVAQNLNVESERFTNTLPRFFMVGASIYLEKWK
jgi:hypothetical protein